MKELEKLFGRQKDIGIIMISVLMISMLTILNIRGNFRIISLLLILVLYSVSYQNTKLWLLFFLAGFNTDLNVSLAGVPYITILQMLFIITIFFRRHWKIEGYIFLTMISLFGMQLYSILKCNANIINIITFGLNLLLLYSISNMNVSVKKIYSIYLAFILGMIITLIAAIFRDDSFFVESYVRFKGLWTDPNFLGMFCVIAIIFLFQIVRKNLIMMLGASPFFLLLLYCGYRTYSKTFILAIIFLTGLLILQILKSDSRAIVKMIYLIVLLGAIYYVFNNYFLEIINLRGSIYQANTNWTNGRLTDTTILLNAWLRKIGTILFGIGIGNSFSYAAVAHNTYVEILAQFGVMGTGILILCFTNLILKSGISFKDFRNANVQYIYIILLYAAALSMESTDLVYYLVGLSIAESRCIRKNIFKEVEDR